MEIQALTIKQMQELIDMGIDTSSASCIWWNFAEIGFALMFLNDGRESLTIEKMKKNHGAENVVPAFTLQDILKLLPHTLEFKDVYENTHFEYIEFWGDGWNQMAVVDPAHPSSPRITTSNINPLRSAFEMLKWIKENNYI